MEASQAKYNFHKAHSRNFGIYSEAEQQALSESTVAVAGAGGDGFQLSYKLAMAGVGKFSIADPEVFEPENSNRVIAATNSNCGKNKAEVFRDWASDLPNPPEVRIYTDGVSGDNVEDFMHGADLVIDESELTYPHIGTMIARQALAQGIPNLTVMNVLHAGVATSYHPNGRYTFEDMMGIAKGTPIDEIAEMSIDFSRCLPYIPEYGDLKTLKAVMDGAPLPSVGTGVDAASGIGGSEAILHLMQKASNHRIRPTWAKNFRYSDLYNGKSGTIHHPRLAYYMGIAKVAARSSLGLNPHASYTQEDRDRRENTAA